MIISKKSTFACALALGLALPTVGMANDGQTRAGKDKTYKSQTLGEREREEYNRTNADMNIERPDAWVLTKVKAKFAGSDLVHATDINVDVNNGVASLRGTVGSSAERREAVRLAQETEGVKKVDASGLRLVPESKD